MKKTAIVKEYQEERNKQETILGNTVFLYFYFIKIIFFLRWKYAQNFLTKFNNKIDGRLQCKCQEERIKKSSISICSKTAPRIFKWRMAFNRPHQGLIHTIGLVSPTFWPLNQFRYSQGERGFKSF